MKVLLVQPRHKARPGFRGGFRTMAVTEPLCLEMVGAVLERDHQVRLVDLHGAADVLPGAVEFGPNACGISCSFTVDVGLTLKIASRLATLRPRPFIFVGGHHASLNPGNFHVPFIDAVVVGEGEKTVSELVTALDAGTEIDAIPGLVLNEGDAQRSTGERELLSDLDALPFPARHLTAAWHSDYYMAFSAPIASVETARGCPFRCSFCSVWRFYRRRHRFKSPERVVAELARLEQKHVLITDDNFFANVSRAMRIADLLEREGVHLRYIVQARTDTIANHPELIARWKEVGLGSVFVGLEKIDAAGLESLKKANTVECNEQALGILRRANIPVMASLIIDPDYDGEDFRAVREYAEAQGIRTPTFTILTPLPGTTLHDELRDSLTTSDCELFDLLHAVVPTRLSLEAFYKEMAGLYSSIYSLRSVPQRILSGLTRDAETIVPNLRLLMRTIGSFRYLTRPREYLIGHDQACLAVRSGTGPRLST